MKALIVEDDATIAEFVGRGLKEAGFVVDRASDGPSGLQMATTSNYDVAIVDVMLPHRDGLSLIDELRRQRIATPVLILSARRSVDDRVRTTCGRPWRACGGRPSSRSPAHPTRVAIARRLPIASRKPIARS